MMRDDARGLSHGERAETGHVPLPTRDVLSHLDEVVHVVTDAAADRARTIVGIAGAPGAGKSTLAGELTARLGQSAVLLPMDGFHYPQERLRELGRRHRMGAPDTFDVEAFVDTLHAARVAAGPVHAPGFDRDIEEPVPNAVLIPADTPIVVVEGNYLLLDTDGWERVSPLVDLKLFVQLDRDIRLARLIDRHERFGKSPAQARAWATGPDEANARLIEATAGSADLTVMIA